MSFFLKRAVFTAPVAGLYTFDVHVIGKKDKSVNVCLRHNDNVVTAAFADDGFGLQSASTYANLQLQQGDEVKVISWSTSYVEGLYFATSFSGQLVAVA